MTARPTPKPWPMKWIVVAIVVFAAGYTAVNFYFRKPGKAYRPYQDAQDRATTARLLNAGWQRVPLTTRRPMEKAATERPSATISRAAVGLGAYEQVALQSEFDRHGIQVIFAKPGIVLAQKKVLPKFAGNVLPRPPGYQGPQTFYEFLQTVKKEGEHGAGFVYRTVHSEVLGWIVSRVTFSARSWRSCASSVIVAIGRASRRCSEIGSPLTSQ